MDEEVKSWFDQALHDLKSANDSCHAGNYDWACFQAQQAAEKSLKALYLKQFHDLRKVHDLVFLATNVKAPPEILDACALLNKVYVDSRYPDAEGQTPAAKFSENDSGQAMKLAESINNMGEKKIVEELKQFRKQLSEEVFVTKMVLFGSRAWGKPHRDSDVDLVVVSPQFRGVRSLERGVGFYKRWRLAYPVDFLCYTPEEFQRLRKKTALLRKVDKEGIEIRAS